MSETHLRVKKGEGFTINSALLVVVALSLFSSSHLLVRDMSERKGRALSRLRGAHFPATGGAPLLTLWEGEIRKMRMNDDDDDDEARSPFPGRQVSFRIKRNQYTR